MTLSQGLDRANHAQGLDRVIHTVLGPIAPDQLGVTSMHEHVIADARGLAEDPDYRLADVERAVAELALAAGAGLATVVDPTGWGFGGPAPALAQISRASGVQVVAGVGIYLGRTRPAWITELGPDALTELFHSALSDTLPGCEFVAGIVGVIAPDHPLTRVDRDILAAAGRAAAATGSAVIVRLDPRYDDGLVLVDLLTAAGLEPDRVVLSNIDGYAGAGGEVLARLADTGATLKWCFGYEVPPRAGMVSATDADRAAAVGQLLAHGAAHQVLACGIWTQAALHVNGGFGYSHLLHSVVPRLRGLGISDVELQSLLVEQPRRLLTRPALVSGHGPLRAG